MDNLLAQNQLRRLKEQYKISPATMAHTLNPSWIATPYLLKISSTIAAAIMKGNARIILSVPPRHGKSELITKYTTIWALERFPHWNTILATYGAELSTDFGKEVRNIIQANEDKLNVRIRSDSSRAANWKTNEGGGMAAVGVGGAITGRGANILLIDDYIKEIKEAESKAHRDYIWKWFTTVALTRIEPGGSCVIIATRWHHDDLIGRLLRENESLGNRWQYIRFPALADEENDILGRKIGEPLFPERYDFDALMERKLTLGTYFFNALFQQIPEDDENKITDAGWLRVETQMPNLQDIPKARIWDLAATQDGGDYTAGSLAGHDKNNNTFYIFNCIRKRLNSAGVEALVRQTAIMDGVDTKIYIEQEPGSSGKALVEHYKNSVLPEFNVEAVPANDGKLVRAQPFLAAAEAGKVVLMKGSWNKDFIDEFATFPRGAHDDQIDTAAIGFVKLVGKKIVAATWGRGSDSHRTNQTKLLTPSNKTGIIFGRNRRR